MVRIFLIWCAGLFSPSLLAQAELLPRGIGLIQLGQRQYDALDSYYDQSGQKEALGNKLSSHLSGSHLRSGKSGADLKRLSSELGRYQDVNGNNLANEIDLGYVNGDIDVKVKSQILGVAYGLTSRWTGFFGIPYVDSSVDAELSHSGANNADAIKRELGDLAFAELESGLERAGQLDTAALYDQIGTKGYQSIDHWQHKGFGDLRVGAKTAFSHNMPKLMRAGTTVTSTLLVPTGYVEQPDVLTDISFGTGYYSLALGIDEAMTFQKQYQLGVSTTGQYNLPTRRKMRVPEESESMISAERETDVKVVPGYDFGASAFTGWDFGLIDVRYRHGFDRHMHDRYSGSLRGNYEVMGSSTGVWKHFHEASVRLDTVESYRKKRFVYPMHLSLNHRRLINGINTPNEKYYELQLNAFFSAR